MAKRNIKINIKLPAGIVASKELVDKASKAAKEVIASTVEDLAEAQKLAKNLASKGINITAEELLNRKTTKATKTAKTAKTSKTTKKTGTKKAAKKSAGAKKSTRSKKSRKRVVLSDAQRDALVADLKNGDKTAALVDKYGVSPATVTNIKSAAGLTKPRGGSK